MTPADLLAKAERAAKTAAELLDRGDDLDAAANRAYYAVFHAARAALEADGVETGGRKHGTILGEFNRRFIRTARLPRVTGRRLSEIQELRNEADYDEAAPDRDEVRRAVAEAAAFVEAVGAVIGGAA